MTQDQFDAAAEDASDYNLVTFFLVSGALPFKVKDFIRVLPGLLKIITNETEETYLDLTHVSAVRFT